MIHFKEWFLNEELVSNIRILGVEPDKDGDVWVSFEMVGADRMPLGAHSTKGKTPVDTIVSKEDDGGMAKLTFRSKSGKLYIAICDWKTAGVINTLLSRKPAARNNARLDMDPLPPSSPMRRSARLDMD